jgi:hypothetical protein
MECGQALDKAELQVVIRDNARTLGEIYKEKTEA